MSWLSDFLNAIRDRLHPKPPPAPNPPPVQPFAVQLLSLHNADRMLAGVPPLVLDPQLTQSAQGHADWMAARSLLSHLEGPGPSRDFTGRMAQAGYVVTYGGENIAEGQRTPEQVYSDWTSDAGHRANVLGGHYKDVGFGMAMDRSGVAYWCADYGQRI